MRLEQEMKKFPEGNLRVSNDRGIPRYFHVLKSSDTRGEYIPKDNIELAQVYTDMNTYRKPLITPKVITDEAFAQAGFYIIENKYKRNHISRASWAFR